MPCDGGLIILCVITFSVFLCVVNSALSFDYKLVLNCASNKWLPVKSDRDLYLDRICILSPQTSPGNA